MAIYLKRYYHLNWQQGMEDSWAIRRSNSLDPSRALGTRVMVLHLGSLSAASAGERSCRASMETWKSWNHASLPTDFSEACLTYVMLCIWLKSYTSYSWQESRSKLAIWHSFFLRHFRTRPYCIRLLFVNDSFILTLPKRLKEVSSCLEGIVKFSGILV